MKSLLKRAAIVMAITVIAPIGAYFAFVRNADTTYYTADVKILFDQPQAISSDQGSNSVNKIIQLLPTYEQVITSYSIANKASELSGISPEEIESSLSAQQIERESLSLGTLKTQVLSLEARSTDPQKAIDIVNAASQAFSDYITKQQNDNNVKPENRMVLSVIDPATQPHADPPKSKRTLLLAAAVGFIISVGGVLVFQDSQRA